MDRLSKYLLRRLHQLGRRAMIRHAVTNGLIEVQIKEVDGHLLRRYEPAFDTSSLSGDVDSDLATIRRRFGVFLKAQGGVKTGTPTVDPFDRSGTLLRAIRAKKEQAAADKGFDTVVEFAGRRPQADQRALPDRRAYGVSLIGRLALPPKVTDVAGCLLLAHAVVDNRVRLQTLRQVLSQPTPIIAIYVLAGGFEKVMVRLLEAGVIIREPMAGAAGEYVYDPVPFDFEEKEATRRFVHFLGRGYHHRSESNVRMRIGQAIDAGHPIVAIAEEMDRISDSLAIGADLNIYSNGLSWTILLDLLQATCRASDAEVLEACSRVSFEPSLLTLDDLSLAIRPGRSLSDILKVMAVLVERTAATEETKDAAKNKKAQASTEAKARPAEPLATSTTERRSSRESSSGPAVEVIMPEDIPDGSSGLPESIKSIEHLVGYGEAKSWGLDLKGDLELYRAGELEWSDMSTKLLLSGPPGTGKTLFARALCNSLQIPMLATSVSTWLQGGHLDGVLSRMAAAFAEAREKAPCILFIDEVDGIGTRPSPDKDYADYWTAVVNKLLELLDGAVKTEGVVVVGATNRPEQIDAAIRRSGRLETHIVIPLPDIGDLGEILRHHLRGDADAVLAEDGRTSGGSTDDDRPLAERGSERHHDTDNNSTTKGTQR